MKHPHSGIAITAFVGAVALLMVGCSEEHSAPKPGSFDPGGWGSFGPPHYPMHQDEPSWSATGAIAYRDNGIISIDSLTGAFSQDPTLAGIWVLEPQTGERRRILSYGFSPAWSPDGQQIAFENAGQIYVMDGDGSNVRQVTAGAQNSFPAWHPDGTRLLYDSDSGGKYDIWVVDVDGSNAMRFCAPVEGDRRLGAWNPDGMGILTAWYSGEFGDHAELYHVDENCHAEHLTVGQVAIVGQPHYSPDGSQIALTIGLESEAIPQVWVMSLDGSGAQPVTPMGGWNPSWSPDGTSVIFARPALTKLSRTYGVLWIVNLQNRSAKQVSGWWPQVGVRR